MARYKKNQYVPPEAPLLYEDHGRPLSRREFIRQGLMTGSASILTGGVFSLFANPQQAHAAVADDLDALATDIGCPLSGVGAGQRRKGNRRGRPLPPRPGRLDGRARIDHCLVGDVMLRRRLASGLPCAAPRS